MHAVSLVQCAPCIWVPRQGRSGLRSCVEKNLKRPFFFLFWSRLLLFSHVVILPFLAANRKNMWKDKERKNWSTPEPTVRSSYTHSASFLCRQSVNMYSSHLLRYKILFQTTLHDNKLRLFHQRNNNKSRYICMCAVILASSKVSFFFLYKSNDLQSYTTSPHRN